MASANTILKFCLDVNDAVIEKSWVEETPTEVGSLHIRMRPYKKDQNRCPFCGKKCPGYDSPATDRVWRAPDFGDGILVYIHSDNKRICCPEHGVLSAAVPWAFNGSRFTKTFDIIVTWLATQMSKKAVADYMRIDWETVGRCISRARNYLEPDPQKRFDGLTYIGVDETSYRKGHKYITVVVNHQTNTVVWASDKHGKEVFTQFCKLLTEEQRKAIKVVTGDGAKWIDQCLEEFFPNAQRCVDGFHVVEWVEDALDDLRTEEWRAALKEAHALEAQLRKENGGKLPKGRPGSEDSTAQDYHNAQAKASAIKGSMYALGKNPEHLTTGQKAQLLFIQQNSKRLYRAYGYKEILRMVFKAETVRDAEVLLDKFYWRASHSRIKQFTELAKKIKRHKEHILNTVRLGMSNARIEATNNKIKLIIRKAYGFHHVSSLIDMVMLVCSGIQIPLPNRPRFDWSETA